MAKKRHYDYRAEQARRRNQEKAAYRKQKAKQKAFLAAHGKKIAIISAAAVVAIVAIWLLCAWFVGPGGSLPNFFGNLHTVEENWIVGNTGSTSNPTYYHLGTYEAPEGYTLDPNYRISSDPHNTNMYFTADEGTSDAVNSLFISSVRNRTAKEQVETLVGYGYSYETSGALEGVLGGHNVHYAYFVYDATENPVTATATNLAEAAPPAQVYTTLAVYIDTVQNSNVVVLLNSPITTYEERITQEQLEAEAQTLVARMTLPQ